MDQDSSAEWSEGPSAALGGAGSKRQGTRAGDSDDVGDGEDADVLNRLGVRLSKNQCIRAKKQRRLKEIYGEWASGQISCIAC